MFLLKIKPARLYNTSQYRSGYLWKKYGCVYWLISFIRGMSMLLAILESHLIVIEHILLAWSVSFYEDCGYYLGIYH